MNRRSHLACFSAMLGLAALAGVAMARWRNQVDRSRNLDAFQPPPPPARVSDLGDDSGRPIHTVASSAAKPDPLEDAGMYFRSPQPWFDIADERGRVTDQGLAQAKVSPGHKDEIQAALDLAWKRILASMKERVQPDERNSNAAQGIRAYLIPAQMGLREEILGKLESDLSKTFDEEQASLLLGALHTGRRFGYFGRQTIMIRLIPGPDGEGQQAEYATFDPVTGNKIFSHSTTSAEAFRDLFGEAIDW